MKNTCHSELVSESKNMTNLPPHPSPLPQGARERTRVAFTLAEVLITLGIIGVVAAMTIPNLITAHQKKVTVTKLQKAISTLNQAYRLAYDEVGEAAVDEAMEMGSEAYFNKYWAPFLKVAQICKTHTDCGYNDERPYQNMSKTDGTKLVVEGKRVPFSTAEGFVYDIIIAGGTPVQAMNFIYVDINGGAGPNIFGKDVFVLERALSEDEKGGVILPLCYKNSTQSINGECTKNGIGSCCAEKIRRDGWQIAKDYPW